MRKVASQAQAIMVESSGAVRAMTRKASKSRDGSTVISVESSGALRVIEPAEDQVMSAGPVAEALYNAKQELANQIQEEKKAKSDTDLTLSRAEADKASKESLLEDAFNMYQKYLKEHDSLKLEIANVTKTIASLTSLSISQQTEIDRLKALHDAKHDAAKTAEDLEALIANLKEQIVKKKEQKASAEGSHQHALQVKDQTCDNRITELSHTISNLTANIDGVQAEYDSLTALHTETYCEEKAAKNQSICKRCAEGEEPCGDTCKAAGETCYHDPGCACKDASASFLEVEPSEGDDAHPLREKLNKAKAEIRKIIAQHQQTMDGYKSSISDNVAQTEELRTQKERAVADYDRALKELSDHKKSMWDSHAIAKANKIKAEEDLAVAIAEGTGAIDKLAKELRDSIAELTAERSRTQQQRAQLITTCEEERKALLSSQGSIISAFVAEISQLNQQETDAQQKLDTLKASHGVEVPTGGDETTTEEPMATVEPPEEPMATVEPPEEPTATVEPTGADDTTTEQPTGADGTALTDADDTTSRALLAHY
jgi:chromosome segregation ATPase